MLVTADASELLLAYSECEILHALVCFCVLVPLQPLLKLFLWLSLYRFSCEEAEVGCGEETEIFALSL